MAGLISLRTGARTDPKLVVKLPLRQTLKVGVTLEKARGGAMASREFSIAPKAGEARFTFLGRRIKSDEQGKVEVDRVVPGLTYHVQEEPPISERSVGGMFRRRNPEFDKDLILAPD